jgi:hypothetical protein
LSWGKRIKAREVPEPQNGLYYFDK